MRGRRQWKRRAIAEVQHHGSRGGWLFALRFAASLALHLAVAAYLLARRPAEFGATERPSDAISVNIELTDFINVREQDASVAGKSPPSDAPEPSKDEP